MDSAVSYLSPNISSDVSLSSLFKNASSYLNICCSFVKFEATDNASSAVFTALSYSAMNIYSFCLILWSFLEYSVFKEVGKASFFNLSNAIVILY